VHAPADPREFSTVPAIPRIRERKLPALGHAAIDSDHSAIADQWLRTASCEPFQFEFFVARLKSLMRKHFEHEAALMERAGSSLCRCHRDEHQSLLDLCDQMRDMSDRSWRKTQSLLRLEFPKLVRKHVLYTDQLAVLFLNTSEKATSPLNATATDLA
jgi:hemerythrin